MSHQLLFRNKSLSSLIGKIITSYRIFCSEKICICDCKSHKAIKVNFFLINIDIMVFVIHEDIQDQRR